MIVTAIVIGFIALIAGGVIGFVLGQRAPKVDPTPYRRVARPGERLPSARKLHEGGNTVVISRPVANVENGTVTFDGAHKGEVFIHLWVGVPTSDVRVEIQWGPARGTILLKELDMTGVALRLEKKNVHAKDSVVQVRTSVPTSRMAAHSTDGLVGKVPVRKDIAWA